MAPRGRRSQRKGVASRVALKRRRKEEEEEEEEEEMVDEGPKLLMRPWLLAQVKLGQIKGLVWKDKDENLLQIPWRHGSSRSWQGDDVKLFEAWAQHSGKSSYLKRGELKPNRLKANFRCAINSQVDIKEEKSYRVAKGADACKVYRFLAEKPRRSEVRKRRRTASSDLENCQGRRPLRSNSSNSGISLDLDHYDHEEEVTSQDHRYSSHGDVVESRIPTTVTQLDEEQNQSYSDDSGDDSAFSETTVSDISEQLVPDWIKSENIEHQILNMFDESALLGSSDQQPLIIEEEELDDAESMILTELIPVPGRPNMSITII